MKEYEKQKLLKMLEEAWQDIEKGWCRKLSKEDFIKELEEYNYNLFTLQIEKHKFYKFE